MTKRIIKYSLSLIFLSMVLILIPVRLDLVSANRANAAGWWDKVNQGGLAEVGKAYGENSPRDIRMTIVDIIKVVLGFLGMIATVIILYAGFKWMTAGGNEENVAEAKKILIAGVIGLAIILSAYALANFVMNQIIGAATGTPVIW